MNPMTPIFTRYLYYKNDVVLSLILSILKKDINQSLFWGYELYYSGFPQEAMDIVLFVYKELYTNLSLKIKLFIQKKRKTWKHNMNRDSLLATLIHVLASRTPDFETFYHKYNSSSSSIKKNTPETEYTKKIIYAVYQESDIEKYRTLDTEGSPRHFLKKVCQYSTIKNAYSIFESFHCPFIKSYCVNVDREELRKYYFYHWEYCAFYTPLWKERFSVYDGNVDIQKKEVLFLDEEKEDMFYKLYGYEPDEQPIEITEKTVGFYNTEKETNPQIKNKEDFISCIKNII